MGSNGVAVHHPSSNGVKQDIKQVWIEYKKSKKDVFRNKLIESYIHLVRYNAERIHVKLPDEVELDDLISSGTFGLIDAINAFDLDRGIKFETYCAPRIRGAMLDELRAMDWVPRLVRSRAHKITNASKQLEVELGRMPTNEEIAKRLQVPMHEFERMAADASAASVVSLSRKWFETDSNKDVREVDVLVDTKTTSPEEKWTAADLREAITRGMGSQMKLILVLFEFEGYSLFEIGEILSISESRVSQVHDEAIKRIKSKTGLRDLVRAM